MFKLLLFTLVVAVAAADITKSITGDKWVTVISNPSSFMFAKANIWQLDTDEDSKIRFYCRLFNVGTAPVDGKCRASAVIFDDGKTKTEMCGWQDYPVQVVSHSSKLKVELTGVGGMLECFAKSQHEPRSFISIKDHGRINFPSKETIEQQNDQAWKITSSPGTKIKAECKVMMTKPHDNVCVLDTLTINDHQFCGRKRLIYESNSNEMTLRVETFRSSNGHVDCVITSS